ncbi:protein translocase subunit SecD [Blattabacterium cuenoti]|uniref:protein translocase subunit SecD n=1 Tax=Blattabacterium cuenoti TaxID=1653831 RepID=UPI00163CD584|nr:protein translocase subunit SecD [Blattabacterium cuenoti]
MRIRNFFTFFIFFSLTIISLYYIIFSIYFYQLDNKNFDQNKKLYIDDFSIYNKILNLGLDLKGGISMILEISEKDLLKKFSNNSTNPFFLKILKITDKKIEQNSNIDYYTTFINSFYKEKQKHKNNLSILDLFNNQFFLKNYDNEYDLNKKIEKLIKNKIELSISTAYNIIKSRIYQLGIHQHHIQRIKNSNKILVELSDIKNIDRIKHILQKKAELNFFEIYNLQDLFPFFEKINKIFSKNGKRSLIDILNIRHIPFNNSIGFVNTKDKNIINNFFNSEKIIDYLPYNLHNIKFIWGYKTYKYKKEKFFQLFAIKNFNKEISQLNGNMIIDAYKSFGPFNEIFINIKMNQEGTRNWKIFTEKNIGKNIAIVLDDLVYTAPNVQSIIYNGISQISGKLSLQESEDLINILNAGKLPSSIKIIQSEIIGPSLGRETIKNGILSFCIAIFFVFIWMIFYYSIPGIYANIILIFNLIFILGIMISTNSVLTLPGIAGIILTLAMSMDSFILIYEKIKENINHGFSIITSINNSYTIKGALSSILDGQITTLLCGCILFYFGIGPIKSFSKTLIIGFFTSVFSSIFLGRFFLEWHLKKYKNISFSKKFFIKKIQWDFLSKRKLNYMISLILILISIFSIFYKKLNYGIDFLGGRSYIIRFDKKVIPEKISLSLSKIFIENGKYSFPEVKTFGKKNQLKIITKYKIQNKSNQVDQEILKKMFLVLKPYYNHINYQNFKKIEKNKFLGILSTEKVEPILASEITNKAIFSIILSFIGIFFYIFIRFKKWQFGVGAIIALLHDIIIVIGFFSFFYKYIPILEIDQTFIAALLTIIGYSINDTVIVYDKIRKYHSKKLTKNIINNGINNSLNRTINTSFITLLVISIIFLFGGTSIRSFMLALFLGVSIGTYSSIFIASSIVYDFSKKK